MAITKINTPEIFDLGATNSSLRLPSGNTASRPSSPSTGEWRYNTDDNKVEYWDGSAWFQIDDESAASAIVPEENFSPTTYLGNGGSTNVLSSKIGNAGYFNGSSSSNIDVSPPPQDNSGAMSISFWAKTSSTSRAAFFIFQAANPNLEFLKLENYGFGGTNSLRVTYDNASSFNINNQAISDNAWHHIVVTAGNGNVKVYKDGSLLATNSVTITDRTISAFAIGYRKYNNDLYFNGGIDQVRIFNRELDETTDGEVTTLYEETYASSTKSTTDIFGDGSGVALYQLDEDANDTGKGQAFTGQSADFNGSSQINVSSNSIFDTTSNFTLSMWVNRDSTSEKSLINKLGSTNSGWFFTWNPTYGYWFVNYNSNGTASTRQNGPSDSTGEWTHLAVTWDASTSTAKLYINGVEPSSNITTVGAGGSTNSNALEIGGYVNYSAMAQMDGQIDDVKWFSSVISDSDIEKLSFNLDTTTTPVANWKLDGNANDSVGSYNGTWSGTAAYSDPAEPFAYNGTPTNVNFLGMAFQPDLVWIKQRDNTRSHRLTDSVRGANKIILSNDTSQELTRTDEIGSFDSNGFTIGANVGVNDNTGDYVAWCFKGGGSAGTYNIDGTGYATLGAAGLSITGINGCSPTFTGCSVNSESGFGIYEIDPNFTASSHRADFAHGLKSTPQLIFAKVIDGTGGNWWAFTNAIDGSWDRGKLQTTDAFIDDTLTGADIATDTLIRIEDAFISTASRVLFYAFASVDGYQKVGTSKGQIQAEIL